MKNKLFKRSAGFLLAAAMTLSTAAALPASAASPSNTEFLKGMGAAWNLGNSLDATGGGNSTSSETSWGNPKTTKAMIEAVHDAGFETIRIPVSWGNHTTGSDYTVNAQWMARVKEVVDYAYDDGMHVILNIHHDNSSKNDSKIYYYPDSAHKDASIKFLTSVWSQIAEEFKDYDDRLVFETINEPRLAGTNDEWWFDANNPNANAADAISVINDFNQEIVNTIRDTGSNNSSRYIMCPGYSASLNGCTTAGYKLPTDPVSANGISKILVSVHAYTPYDLCLGSNTDITTPKYCQFTDSSKKELDELFKTLQDKFTSKGVGVVIGEMGISNKNNNSARTEWASYFYGLSKKYTIPCALWDNNAKNGSSKSENHWHLNRKNCKWGDPDVINAIMNSMGVTNTSIPADDDYVVKQSQTITGTSSYLKTYGGSSFTLNAKNTTSGGGALSYSSSDTNVVTVNSSGSVTIKGAGTATITVTAAENSKYALTKKEIKITVNPKAVTNAVISAIPDQKYTGSKIEPAFTVKVGAKALAKNRDYTVKYSDNTNPGTATVKITFTGNYSGTASATFKITGTVTVVKPDTPVITKTSSTKDAVRINWNKASNAAGYRIYRYNSSTKKWDKIATVGKSTLTYRDEKLSAAKVYKYKVKAYNKANGATEWSDVSKTVSVLTKPVNVKITKVSKSKTAVRLTWSKVSCTGYKVQKYDSAAKKWVTVKNVPATSNEYKITGLKANTSYQFRIQAYQKSSGMTSYSGWTGTSTVTKK